ncbi:MAG: hypothetical protein WBV28_23225, partial [Terracidiphilus sp.]
TSRHGNAIEGSKGRGDFIKKLPGIDVERMPNCIGNKELKVGMIPQWLKHLRGRVKIDLALIPAFRFGVRGALRFGGIRVWVNSWDAWGGLSEITPHRITLGKAE